MKENKNISVGVRLSDSQNSALLKLVSEGRAKNVSGAIQHLINQYIILEK